MTSVSREECLREIISQKLNMKDKSWYLEPKTDNVYYLRKKGQEYIPARYVKTTFGERNVYIPHTAIDDTTLANIFGVRNVTATSIARILLGFTSKN